MSGREQPPIIDPPIIDPPIIDPPIIDPPIIDPPIIDRAQSQCYGDTCITCSDEALPVVLVELLADDLALADTGSGVEEVSIALVEAGAGDTVLVHAREAIAVLPRTAATGDADPGGGGR